jgi:hypothetical protein
MIPRQRNRNDFLNIAAEASLATTGCDESEVWVGVLELMAAAGVYVYVYGKV